ncbi:tetratricopeptide repeat protein [Lyngbya confervoides]|uniref:Tetratricopeptide repeat protein n=1 Tax=Lyngbya confervoides BDU141951 TaxID=1574623 RepID=A0ABD4T899_9CYAN|nr:tetratricopeptide repeat protein [Lyngbya confervoides]MCM1985014.1 tetratricopeptide repeat protein [Lyngbya confervoides BDU141951]
MRVSRYTPSLLSHENLEAIFVQRHKLAQTLVELVQESVVSRNKHYTLLIGPRGIGKTHLVSLVYHRVMELEAIQDRLKIAWLREEEWGISSFFDLLLRILRALQEANPGAKLKEKTVAFYEMSLDVAEKQALQLLHEYLGQNTLLLLMENSDEIFQGLGDEGQKKLRSLLQETGCCTIIATSQSLFNGVKLQTSPFYGFFRIRYLKDFSVDEAVTLLRNIAALEGNQNLVRFLATAEGRRRVQAVHHLAGGNPRIYVVFSEFLTCESLDDLIDPFMQMLDDLTPYYQARMSYLSPQQRKILEVLCSRRYAMPVKDIAQQCFATSQTTSSQLKDLRDKGYVVSETYGRLAFYELREPLMRICLSVKQARGEPIRLIVDFLRTWYGRKNLEAMYDGLMTVRGRAAKNDRATALGVQGCSTLATENHRIYLEQALREELEKESDPRISVCVEALYQHSRSQNFAELCADAQKLVRLRGNDLDHFNLGLALGNLGRYEESITSFERVLEIKPDINEAWYDRGISFANLGRYEEAIASYDRALEIKPDDNQAWNHRGISLGYLGRYEDAIASYDRALEHHPDSIWARLNRAELLFCQNISEQQLTELESALQSLTHAEQKRGWHFDLGLQALFQKFDDSANWQSWLRKLIQVFDDANCISALTQGLTQQAAKLTSEQVSQAKAEAWLQVWQELVGDRREFQIPLRLLSATLQYKKAPDDLSVFMALPIEERKILKQLLNIE